MPARVLAVDDNPTNLELMLYLLRSFGHEVDGFTSPVQALDRLEQQRYDLILVDIRMPVIDGFEFARRVNADPRNEHTCLVAVTAMAMVGDKERVMSSGFDGYIPKPIDPEHFVREVERILAVGHKQGGSTSRILVVDDEQVNIDVIRGTLAPFGYDIVEANNIRDAIAMIDERKPALILSDVHMQGGDGLELLDYVLARPDLEGIPFYFISSTMWQTAERRLALERGARKFLSRPIEPQALLSEVRAALGEDSSG